MANTHPISNTAERPSSDASFNFFYQRFCLAYKTASEMINGIVLEAGTGTGYGLSWLSPNAKSLLGIDKYNTAALIDTFQYPNFEFRKMKFPPFSEIPDQTFDYVISFHVIEHIRKDLFFVQEVKRVLKENGIFIVSTPNSLMTLARNPFHIREYTSIQFKNLLSNYFATIEACGVFGKANAMQYYFKNKSSIEKITRLDIFRFQQWLPNCLLRIPYEMLNRFNRLRMYNKHETVLNDIQMNDFYIAPVNDECLDLFYICTK